MEVQICTSNNINIFIMCTKVQIHVVYMIDRTKLQLHFKVSDKTTVMVNK